MTVILGAKCPDTGAVYVAGDSLWTGGSGEYGHERKYVERKNYVIGLSGDVPGIQAIKHEVCLPNDFRDSTAVYEFAQDVKAILGDRKDEVEMIIATNHGGLYVIDSWFAYSIVSLASMGTGGDLARGAYLAMDRSLPVKERLRRAVKIACTENKSCGPPVWCRSRGWES